MFCLFYIPRVRMGCGFQFKRERTFFFEAKREHIQVTKSKLAPLQRRSVLDDLVLSLKSLKSSCPFHIPRARIRCWAEFKRRMINFWITFWSIISELTNTVLLSLKGKYLKNIFFLKRRSFPFHTLKRRTTDVKFCVGLLKAKENMFELVRQPCFEFEKLLCFPLYIPRARMRCWFEFERVMVYFWTTFQSKTIWGALLDMKPHSVSFHILNRRTTHVKLCVVVFSIQYLSTKAVSHLKRGMMPI